MSTALPQKRRYCMIEKICLNGFWDFMPIYNEESCLEIPKDIEFEDEKIIVPSSWRYKREDGFNVYDDFEPLNQNGYPENWNNAQTALYHRTFTLSEEMLERKVVLCLDGAAQMSAVYVNDVFVGKWDEMYLTAKFDISDFVTAGENDLKIVCTSFESITIDSGNEKSTGLVGSWYGTVCRGLWNDVYIDFESYTSIADTFITTSVENKEISLKFTVANNTDTKSKIALEAEIIDDENIVKTFKIGKLGIKKNSSKDIQIIEPWEDPVLWDIDNPHLYTLVARLYEEQEVIDTKIIKFGFREIKTEGPYFILNGSRINLRGDSWHFQGAAQMTKQYALNWYKMAKENGVNYIRLHAEPYPEYYLDAADEAGMLIVDETAIYGSSKSMYAGNSIFLDRCRAHIKRLVNRDKNHPSVILWSIENEMRWVDGRNEFKEHIPEFMNIVSELDGTRKIILEGDNRLLASDKTQIDTYHYNIDGTFAQWTRERPLVIGERCGLWYVCPQNASAYNGLCAYGNVYDTFIGFAKKEQLYVEDARRKDVSGVSVFNFAYYFETSFPDKDIELNWDNFESFGVKPKTIKKYSLTVNNGLLSEYPIYNPNPAMEYISSSFKPVTIIGREYDSSFFDGKDIERTFDIYNDTRRAHDCKVVYSLTLGDEIIAENNFSFRAKPGEHFEWKLTIPKTKVSAKSKITLTASLFHEDELAHRMTKEYSIYPSSIKSTPVDINSKPAFYGSDETYEIVKRLLPNCSRISTIDDATVYSPDVLILGDRINDNANDCQMILEDYVSDGGVLVCLEQDRFALGDLSLYNSEFFSAHAGDYSHGILKGLSDEDLMFWAPTVTEERPESIISAAFVKPVKGDIKFVLECAKGDYADGGDLWSPLIEYGFKKGRMIFNQLELIKNFALVPAACVLLRNILQYAALSQSHDNGRTATVVHDSTKLFLDKCGLEYKPISYTNTYRNNVIIADADMISARDIDNIKLFVKNGGTLFILPFTGAETETLSRLCETEISCETIPTYHIASIDHGVTDNISVVDFYQYEKVPMSPRQVVNSIIAENTVSAENGLPLAKSITGTPWYDYYVRGCADEYAIIPLVSMNAENKQEEKTYLHQISLGLGNIILSQIATDPDNEKDIRIYSRMFANLGCNITGDIFSYRKTDKDYAVDSFMTLPCPPYKNYTAALEYYTDKEYSLNNLGEGLYGWMRKIEKNLSDGFVTVPQSKNERLFLTCFADYLGEETQVEASADMTANADADLWINGENLKKGGKFTMLSGVNRIVIDTKAAENEDFSVRLIIKDKHGEPIRNTVYHLTIDEVNPK